MDDIKYTYFNTTYDKYYQKVMTFVVAKCSDIGYVEDIVQETFAEFFSVIDKKGISYIKNEHALLLRIAKVRVYRHYSLKARLKNLVPLIKKNKEGEETENFRFEYKDVEESYINSYTIKEVWRQIRTYPTDIQKIFVLHFHLDKPLREVAELLEMTESNVKHKLYRTIGKLRKLYGGEEAT